MLDLDLSTEFGARVDRRLREERIIWLTTIGADNTPQPSPVWFLWDGAQILMYSQPDTPKIRNIARTPRIALNFDGDGRGGNIIVMTSTARVDTNAPPANQVADYVTKYQEGFKRIQVTPDGFAQSYSVPIRIIPQRVRGH